MRFIVFSVSCQYGLMASAASSARTCKMRVLMAPAENHFYFLSIVVPADGIKTAILRKRRLRYVTVLWAALSQATACLYPCVAGVPTVNHNTGSGNN